MPRISLTLSAFLLLLPVAATAHTLAPPDSVGVVVRQNKTFVRHRVKAGETMYGLARRYRVSVEQIMAANPGIKAELVSGQEVLIPRQRAVLPASGTAAAPKTAPAAGEAAASAAAKALTTDAAGNRVYKVQPGQTLFAIARKFGVTPAALQRYNKLPANGGVQVGQTLIIVPAGGNSEAVAATPKAAPASRPERDDAAEKERDTEQEAEREKEREAAKAREAEKTRETASSPVATPGAAPSAPAADENKEPARANEVVRRVTEAGIAAVIEGGRSDKYLALHKTAQVGTIMMVRNIMNGRVVYVRVIGKLPDTGDNANVLIRLSRNAVSMLNTPDQRFRVETAYLAD